MAMYKKILALLMSIVVVTGLVTACSKGDIAVRNSTEQTTIAANATQSSTEETTKQTQTTQLEKTTKAQSEKNSFETADKAAVNMKCGWNLGNTLDSFGLWINGTTYDAYETAWGNVLTTPQLITLVKSQGFNTIRVPVTYAQHMDSQGNIDSKWLERVKEVVDYCISQNMYCIINVHHDTGAGEVAWLKADKNMYSQGMKDKYAKVWTQIAECFKDYNEHLIFEGFNELLDSANNWNESDASAYEVVNNLNQLFVDTVRKTGGNNSERNLIVNPYAASPNESTAKAMTLPKDSVVNHLMVSVHVYTPWNFCEGQDKTFDENDKKEIEAVFERIDTNLVKRLKVPVIIGEYAVKNDNNPQYSAELTKYTACMMEEAAKYNMTCIMWDNGTDMSVIDRKNLTVSQPDAVKNITK